MAGSAERLQEALGDRYSIERPLGEGGMATVWLAQDLKHERQVAIKVLRPELAATLGPERFLREIHIAALLQHPHILPLLDSGEAGGFLYFVMPYVEGESLRERLARHGELPIHDAVKILTEVVDALAYAHAHDVVHRDIKPDNVLLSGRHALVTDFGIAKAVSEATGRQQLTTAGVALGTPAYMSPEQAAADPHLDHRVDIYAVGALGYELLAGRPPFSGATSQEILAAHVTQAPVPLTARRPACSAVLAGVIMRCLEKRPADRWQSAEELLAQLEPLGTPSGGTTPTATRPTAAVVPAPAGSKRVAVLAGLGFAAAVLAALAFWPRSRGPEIAIGKSTQVTRDPGLEYDAAISPDGKFVAYAVDVPAGQRIIVRQVEGGAPVMIARDAPRVQTMPLWSPDGQRLLYASERGIEVIPALGGPSRVVVPAPPRNGYWFSGAWSPDGREFAYAVGDSIFIRPVDGGTPRPVAGVHVAHSFAWSPDGRWLAYVSGNFNARIPGSSYGNIASSSIGVVPAAGGAPVPVTSGADIDVSPLWLGNRRTLLFVSNRDGPRDIYAVSLDGNGRPRGVPVRLTTGLGASFITLAADGATLAYTIFAERSNVWSVPIPTEPPVSISRATPVTTGNQVIEAFDISPDGHWIAFDSDRGGNFDIWRMPLGGGEPEQLTSGPNRKFWPAWSPDGREIAFHAIEGGRRDLYVIPGTGGTPVRVTVGPDDYRGVRWFSDGRRLYAEGNSLDSGYTAVVERGADGNWGPPRPLRLPGSSMSPDGRLAVVAPPGGGVALYSAEGDSIRTLVPAGAGAVFAAISEWAADGSRIFFIQSDASGAATALSSAPVNGGPVRVLVRFDDPTRPWHRYRIGVHGDRLYFTLGERESDVWVAEVKTP